MQDCMRDIESMSKLKPKFSAIVKKGKLILDDPIAFLSQLRSMEDRAIVLTLEYKKKLRSLKENKYYWGVVVAILQDWSGEDEAEVIHEALKRKFLSSRAYKDLLFTQSTTNLSTAEFEDYCAKIRQWASLEHGVYIPLPNEPISHQIYEEGI